MDSNQQIEIIPQSNLSEIIKSEIDVQISTAKAYPRSITTFKAKAMSMATISPEVAEACSYALPRGDKTLEGPSVRLAEIVCASYGNVRAAARVISNDGKTIVAQGVCHDLETNYSASVEVRRSILQHEWKTNPTTRKREKTGRMVTMSEDMQVVVGNAACAIAYRNAVFKVVPSALVTEVYEKAREVARGNAETLPARRDKAVKWFTDRKVTEQQICDVLQVKKIADIDLDLLQTLSAYKAAIANGESTIKEIFEPAAMDPKVLEEIEKKLIEAKDDNDFNIILNTYAEFAEEPEFQRKFVYYQRKNLRK